ncbi:pseudopaline exporter CntI-like [Rhodnius prolixus]|uniref:pseudopaline exporter CntI-like n=1 Tax=Rhodnius prolixus TaxID=13249 RepID=UPI003D18DC93
MDFTNCWRTPRSGVLLAAASSFLLSVCSVLVKVTDIPVGQITFISSLVLFIASVVLTTVNTKQALFPKEQLTKLWGRTLFSLPIVISSYAAVRLLPLSDEALLAYTSIIFTIILGRVLLGERFTKSKLAASAGILTGVFLITIGPAPVEPTYLAGCLFALIGAICDPFSYILLKELVSLHYSVILFNYSLCSLILTAPFSLWETWTWIQSFRLFSIATVATLQEVLLTISLTTEQAGLVCLIHASDIIFSYALELSMFNETYTILKVSGAVMVTISVVFSAYLPASEGQLILTGEEESEDTAPCLTDDCI